MVVLGLNGAQGTGKSTLARLLRALLERIYRMRVAILSLDDLYLTAAERARGVVRRILTFSRRGSLERRPIALADLVREVLQFMRASLPSSVTIRSPPATSPPTLARRRPARHGPGG